MLIINNIDELQIESGSAVAIGKFDGIHLGHVKLINYILEKKKEGLKAVVFTFDISASSFFSGEDIKEITTIEEKRILFEKMGVDVLIEYPLNKETASISPENFVKDILVKGLHMSYIAAGDDISFGNRGLGDAKLIKELSAVCGYEYCFIEKLTYEGKDISSSYVRSEIEKGNMQTVEKLLGHPYSFTGVVASGFKLGRKLGMPTMNQYPDKDKILPPYGVYYSKVKYKNNIYNGITNIGMRPTVSNDNHVSVETYLYDFNEDMYGEDIETFLLHYKRPEMKFDSVEDLKAQMQMDIEEGRKYYFT